MQVTFTGTARCAAVALAAAVVSLVLVAGAAARPAATIAPEPVCYAPANTFLAYTDPATTSCSTDWSVSPQYDGPTYADNTAAAAGDPPSQTPPAVPLATWRNLYDWPNGHGYVGWHSASSPFSGAYGIQSNLGGQYGLWLWPSGDQWYDQTEYAEWTYTAPGTTRLSSAKLSFAYRNKLLAHHCIDIGFRTLAGVVTSLTTYCKPAQPPDSQRNVDVSLADPSSNPTSKVLFFRIRLACNGSETTCSKYIPTLDPLTNGPSARLLKADMTLVDDDNPVLAKVSDGVDGFNDLYNVSIKASDAGSGVKSLKIERVGGPVFASADAPCDAAHNTAALDARICPSDFTLNGTLDISDLEDGTYTFKATAVDVAGNVGTLIWTVVIDRVSLDVTLSPLTATPRDKYTTATQNDFGWNGAERVPRAATRQGYKWRFALASNQALRPLSNGGVAVVTLNPDDATDPTADDYSDGAPPDPSTVDPVTDVPDNPDAADPDFVDDPPVNDDADTWTPVPTVGVDGALDTVEVAQNDVTDGTVDAVVKPPAARDAAGNAVAASFAISGSVLRLTISHRAGTYAYPVTASADMIDMDDDTAGTQSTLSTFSVRSLAKRKLAAVTCDPKNRPQIVVYGQNGWQTLLDALKDNPTPCADYYINMNSPPPKVDNSVDPPKVTSWEPKRHPRPNAIAQIICAASAADKPLALGAKFYPLAEFSTNAWRNWVIDLHRGTWRDAGVKFRGMMRTETGMGTDAGKCKATGEIIPERWSFNEVPSTWVQKAQRKDGTFILPADVRLGVRKAMAGLFFGPTGYPKRRGFPWVFARSNAQSTNFDGYRGGMRTAVQDTNFWNAVGSYVVGFGQEAYTNGFKNLVAGVSIQARAAYLNAYAMHPADLAFAARSSTDASVRAATSAARAAMGKRYYPLLNGYCCSGQGYGYTGEMNKNDPTWTRMRGLVSLELYAARRRATGLNAGQNPGLSPLHGKYPHLTVGIAWNELASTDADIANDRVLAAHIAKALVAAYDPVNGRAFNACTVDPGDAPNGNWCTAVAPTPDVANPPKPLISKLNPCWLRFQSWTKPNGSCG